MEFIYCLLRSVDSYRGLARIAKKQDTNGMADASARKETRTMSSRANHVHFDSFQIALSLQYTNNLMHESPAGRRE